MFCFLRNVSFYAVDLDVTNQPEDIKREIKGLLQDGIVKRCVTPIWRVVYNHQDVGVILKWVVVTIIIYYVFK